MEVQTSGRLEVQAFWSVSRAEGVVALTVCG